MERDPRQESDGAGVDPHAAHAARPPSLRRPAARAPTAPIPAVERGGLLVCSFGQQRLWFLSQLEGMSAAYHMPFGVRLRGALDAPALRAALDRLVARHEALRTTFVAVEGEPFQRIGPAEAGFRLSRADLSAEPDPEAALAARAEAEVAAPFDLERGPPIRGQLIRMAEDEHVLLITMHHIVSDGWSMGVLMREFGALYAAAQAGQDDPLPPLAIQYADFAAWQRRRLEGEALSRQIDYWRGALAGAPDVLDLPLDRPRPARMTGRGGVASFTLEPALTEAIGDMARREKSSLFIVLLAMFKAVLARWSGESDIVVGSPIAGRVPGTESLIGFFVNTLPLRTAVAARTTFRTHLRRVREVVLSAQANQDVPFEQLVADLRPSRTASSHPIFQTAFTFEDVAAGPVRFCGLSVEPVGGASLTSKWDLSLKFTRTASGLDAFFEYSTDVFDAPTIDRLGGYFRTFAKAAVADPDRGLHDIVLLSPEEEQRLLVDWNDTARPRDPGAFLHTLFSRQASSTPDAIALATEDSRLTYAELDAWSNQLAHRLRALGVGPESLVALCFERSEKLIVGMLGILKAGGAYLPLDPGYPPDRLAFILEDSGAALMVADPVVEAADWCAGATRVSLDRAELDGAGWPTSAPDVMLRPQNLAYVIYTSGSTGRPKGVCIQHGSLANLTATLREMWPIEPEANVLQFATFGFDVSILEVAIAFTSGATLHIADQSQLMPGPDLADLLRRRAISFVLLPPSALASMPDRDFPGLTTILTAGEACPAQLAADWSRVAPMYNAYGPTETTIIVTCGELEDGRFPIGRPLANVQAYVLDEALVPVPAGTVGELFIAGEGLARGYHGRPDLTAERFIPNPFGAPGSRLYRTGDRVRHLADGSLDYLGRFDNQIKLRGYRIELGEIESVLLTHPRVVQAAVVLREDLPGEKRLVAYCVGDDAGAPDPSSLREHLQTLLPDYMVPAAYVILPAMPLTPSGKIDRRALPPPRDDAFAAAAYEAPSGPVETVLADIWRELLGVERIGRHDNFFDLGGHSLTAARLVAKACAALQADVPLMAVFAAPKLSGLAELFEQRGHRAAAPIPVVERGGLLVCSFGQQRLWFLSQLEGMSAAYHMPFGVRLRGALDAPALRAALDRLVARHEALRTTFVAVEGEPFQRIGPAEAGFRLTRADLSAEPDLEAALAARAEAEVAAPFDLERGPPIRGQLIRMAEDEHVLLITMHHIVSDGWSMGVLMREFGALYAAAQAGQDDPLPPLAIQYADFAAWQRRRLEGETLSRQIDYWRGALAGAPDVLDLPLDRPRPETLDVAGGMVGWSFAEDVAERLKPLCRSEGATLFMAVLAAWAVVLSRLSRQEDVVIGTPVAGRTHTDLDPLIGLFVNTLALRIDTSGNPSMRTLLRRARETVLAAQEHQDIPFEQVVEHVQPARSVAHTPVFQVELAWQSDAPGALELPGLASSAFPLASRTSRFDLSLNAAESEGRLTGGFEFSTAVLDAATVERHAAYLSNVLTALVEDPDQPIAAAQMLPPGERRQQLIAWNDTGAAETPPLCIHELFEQQADRTPDAVALVHDGLSLSYGVLNRRANALALHLRQLGVGPEGKVAVCMERSVEMVVGVLATLKAGGAYVPLDPVYPAARLGHMLADSAPAVVLTHAACGAALSAAFAAAGGVAAEVVDLDSLQEELAPGEDVPVAEIGLTPRNLAYVVYTSGSTGMPKGVLVEHRSVVAVACGQARLHRLRPGMASLQMASFSFDIFTGDLVRALCHGGRLVICPRDALMDAGKLYDLIERERIAIAEFVPVVLRNLIDHLERTGKGLTGIDAIICGADVWTPRDHRRLRGVVPPGASIINTYGITEATIDSGYIDLTDYELGDLPSIPVGRPIGRTRLFVLDAWLSPVPVGTVGEIHVGGEGLARGYQNRPDLTAERFPACPFADGERLYKTGDLGRYRPDGIIEFLGRGDFQVKIRGFRVELGEVEARLGAHPGVADVAVLARDIDIGDKRLVAYFTCPAGEAVPTPNALRQHMSKALPGHMVPAAFVRLDRFPLTPNAKLDRSALPEPGDDSFASRHYEPPLGPVEETLAQIWSTILGVAKVGRNDNFFELGGHSLAAVKALAMADAAGLRLTMQDVFAAGTLAALAALHESKTPQAGLLPGRTAAGPGSPLVLLKDGTGAPLFLFHALGGGLQMYAELAAQFDREPVYGVHGFSEDARLTRARSIEDIARVYADHLAQALPEGSFRLLGWSFGGLLAHKVAQALQRDGRSVSLLALVDAFAPADDRLLYPAGMDVWEAFLAFLAGEGELGGGGKDVAAGGIGREDVAALAAHAGGSRGQPATRTAADLEKQFSVFSRHVSAAGRWSPDPFAGDAVHYVAGHEPDADRTATLLWPPLIGGRYEPVVLAADHRSILSGPPVQTIVRDILERLE